MAPVYLDELPETTVEISKVYGLIVQPGKYWFDYKMRVIIRKCNLEFDPKPYALIQGPKFQPVLKERDQPSKRFDYDKVILSFTNLYNRRITEREK